MSKLRKFVEQVDSQADLDVDTIVIDKESAEAVGNLTRRFLENAAKGGRKSGEARQKNLSMTPRAIRARKYMEKHRAKKK